MARTNLQVDTTQTEDDALAALAARRGAANAAALFNDAIASIISDAIQTFNETVGSAFADATPSEQASIRATLRKYNSKL